MRFKSVRLSPHLKTAFTGQLSVGLASGDLPFVLLTVGGSTTRLMRGQVLPTGGRDFHIENVLSRTGQVTLAFDMEPTLGHASKPEFDVADEYHFDTFVSAVSGATTGVGMMPKTGAIEVTLSSSTGINMIVYPNILPANLAVKPAGFMDDTVPPQMSTIGNQFTNAEIVLGSYTDAQAAAWVTASNYTSTPIKLAFLKEGTFEIRSGAAVFFVSNQLDEKFDASFVVRDLGARNVERVV